MEQKGLEKWRIAQGWASFNYYDEPRSRYDEEKKDIVFIGMERRKYTKKQKKSKEPKE